MHINKAKSEYIEVILLKSIGILDRWNESLARSLYADSGFVGCCIM
jgi:hypothetical protein